MKVFRTITTDVLKDEESKQIILNAGDEVEMLECRINDDTYSGIEVKVLLNGDIHWICSSFLIHNYDE